MLIFITLAGYNSNLKTELINYYTDPIRGELLVCFNIKAGFHSIYLYNMFYNVSTIGVFIGNLIFPTATEGFETKQNSHSSHSSSCYTVFTLERDMSSLLVVDNDVYFFQFNFHSS